MEYSKKDDWQINKHVQERLVKAWIDVSKLRIYTTKGNVEIKGVLDFTGAGQVNMDSPIAVMNLLKKLDSSLKAVPKVRQISYSLTMYQA